MENPQTPMNSQPDISSGLSPLQQVAAESLDELFSTDPEQLTEEDIEKIVCVLRARRELFATEDAAAKNAKRAVKPSAIVPKDKAEPKAKKPRKTKSSELLGGIEIELDLGL